MECKIDDSRKYINDLNTLSIDILSLLDDDCDHRLYEDELDELWHTIKKVAPNEGKWINDKKSSVTIADKFELRRLL